MPPYWCVLSAIVYHTVLRCSSSPCPALFGATSSPGHPSLRRANQHRLVFAKIEGEAPATRESMAEAATRQPRHRGHEPRRERD